MSDQIIFVAPNGDDSHAGSAGDPVKSLSRAHASRRSGCSILLKRGGTYDTSDGITIKLANIAIAAWGEGATPIVRFTGAKKFTPIIHHIGDGLTIADVNFDSIYNVNDASAPLPTGIACARGRVGITNSTITGCDYGIKIDGASDVTLTKVAVPRASEYPLWCSLGADRVTMAQNVVATDCFFGVSIHQHAVRVHSTKGFKLLNCAIDTRTYKSALCLRDGENFLIEGCKILGNVILCPLMDGDGGCNDPAGAERTRKMALRLRGLKIHNCDINPFDNNGITIGMGGIDIVVDANRIHTATSFATSLKIDSRYNDRGQSNGAVTNNVVTAGTNFTTMARHNNGKFAVSGNTLNGQPFNK